MNIDDVKQIEIPEGTVKKIIRDGEVIWEAR